MRKSNLFLPYLAINLFPLAGMFIHASMKFCIEELIAHLLVPHSCSDPCVFRSLKVYASKMILFGFLS